MKFSFSILLIIAYFNSQGQISIINRGLTDSSANVFYIGIENRILVKGLRNDHVLNITGAGASVYKEHANEFIIKVNNRDSCKITIGNSSGKIVFKKTYRTDTLPQAVASLNGLFNTGLSKNRILLNPYLRVVFPGSYLRSHDSILNFNATFIQNADSIATQGYISSFSQEQIKIIRGLQPGDMIFFTEIRTSEIDGRTTTLPDFWIRIE